jgi:ERCC4-type nuclease
MNILLRVDNREPGDLKDKFKNPPAYVVEFGNLPAGDFEFINQTTGSTLLLIERKEVNDLAASLADGRFDLQKSKLSAACVGLFPVAYLIEGQYDGHEKQSAIETIMLTTPFRDGFFVLESANLEHTYLLINRIADLYMRNKMDQLSDAELHRRFIASRSAHRSAPQTAGGNWWTLSLGQIQSVGPQAAIAIAAKYGSVDALITAYKTSDDPAGLLKEIKTGSRRVGPKVSETVWRTIMNQSPPTEKKVVKKKVRTTTTKNMVTDECLFSVNNDD